MVNETKGLITHYGDVGNTTQACRFEIKLVNGQPRALTRNISPIHTYHARGQLTNEQFSAGAELYRCYYHGVIQGFSAGCTMNLFERLRSAKPEFEGDFHWDCLKKFEKGLLAARRRRLIVFEVCCNEKSVASLYGGRQARQTARENLGKGLNNVAREFGFL